MTQPPTPSSGDQGPYYGGSQQPQYGEPQQQYGGSQPPHSGGTQQQPYGGSQPAGGQGPDSAGFVKALFDFSFKSFVTVRFAAVIYGIALALIAIGVLVGIIASFVTMTESVIGGLLMLLAVLIAAPIYLVLIRVSLEFYVAMIRTAQNTGQTNAELNSLRWEMSQRR